jgi:hypothetical protein
LQNNNKKVGEKGRGTTKKNLSSISSVIIIPSAGESGNDPSGGGYYVHSVVAIVSDEQIPIGVSIDEKGLEESGGSCLIIEQTF